MSLLPTASESLRATEERLQRVAERLAQLPLSISSAAPEDVVNLSTEVVALLQAKTAHAVDIKVVETATEMDRRILDILG
ncbi:MAG: hypothetical protein HYX27_20170 [Acidobacteria bacterium]|nr:hypothetical protein [Acidobacteriota bacterium]